MAASPSSSDERYPIGSVLDGRYRIEAVLGTGGMGRVYRAEHTKIGKIVAIKVLHADLHRNREASQRFQREAIASGRLDHPNIVAVSDFGVLDDGACYLVMEVLEGESLGDRLLRDKRVHWVEAIEIIRGVLHGLRHAHERGVVHRDIKPDNVFLARKDGDSIIKILDFGIAKLYAGRADDPASTRAGLTVGTPAYLSPEQAVGGEITPTSDLYSTSIVLYEMLAGRAPFEDKDPLAMLGAHVSRRPPRFADTAAGVNIPPALEDIVQHGLTKAVAERIATASDYIAMLDAFSPPLRATRRVTLPELARVAEAAGRLSWSGAAPARDPSWLGPAVSSSAAAKAGVPRAASPSVSSSSATLPPAGAAPLEPSQRALQAVSLGEISEPIPLTWIVRSGVVIGFVIIAAVVLAIAAHCHGSEPAPRLAVKPTAKSATPPVTDRTRPAARDAQLDAAARELETAKTCAARKAALGKLAELRDRRAIAPLESARERGDNGCLRADADKAIKDLKDLK